MNEEMNNYEVEIKRTESMDEALNNAFDEIMKIVKQPTDEEIKRISEAIAQVYHVSIHDAFLQGIDLGIKIMKEPIQELH